MQKQCTDAEKERRAAKRESGWDELGEGERRGHAAEPVGGGDDDPEPTAGHSGLSLALSAGLSGKEIQKRGHAYTHNPLTLLHSGNWRSIVKQVYINKVSKTNKSKQKQQVA